MGRIIGHMRANVVAYLALFFALGGIAGAAAQPLLDKSGSVQGRHIEAGAVGMKKLAPSVRSEIDVPLPQDGLYAGNGGGMNIEARVLGGQITDMAVIGACDWQVNGGGYDANGSSWTYQSAGPENLAMQAFGEIVDEQTLLVDQVLTGVVGSGDPQECDGPVTLKPQPAGR
jgi:hypothetical protein